MIMLLDNIVKHSLSDVEDTKRAAIFAHFHENLVFGILFEHRILRIKHQS